MSRTLPCGHEADPAAPGMRLAGERAEQDRHEPDDDVCRYGPESGGVMSARRVTSGVAALCTMVLLAMPAVAGAVTANGISYAGSSKCLECHGRTSGRWQVGSYLNTLHSLNVRTIDEIGGVAKIFPAPASAAWPSPLIQGGTFRFAPADVAYQMGGPDSHTTRFISRFGNDKPHALSTGYTQPTTAGPKDDLVLFNGRYMSHEGYWYPSAITPRLVMQNCGPCHFTGVSRPAQTDYTLPNGSKMTSSTPTSFSEHGIRCEACHAANGGDKHWSANVPISRTANVLKSQTCGQCHVKFTSKQRNTTNSTWTNPNGFTPDQKLADFGTVTGSQWVKKSFDEPAPSIPLTDTTFFPSGHVKAGGHGDGIYNEWLLSGHSRSLRTQSGALYIPFLKDECLPCHSGEAFLKSIGYGSDGPNDIGLHRSSIASDTLNIECGVCHAVHPKSGTGTQLRLGADDLCMKCHGVNCPIGGTVEIRTGKGLAGVGGTRQWMPGAECYECHMPETVEGDRSHRFTIMMPGDRERWAAPAAAPLDTDSCSPCHHGKTLTQLQADIDAWQSATEKRLASAKSAVASAKKRAASKSGPGKALLAAAEKNVSLVEGDGSKGVHNYPYATAGLERAVVFARGVGARFTAFASSPYSPGARVAFVHGTLRMGDGSAARGELVRIEARQAGATRWSPVATVATGDGGAFAWPVRPSRTTAYRAVWSPLAGVSVSSAVNTVRR